MGFFHQARLSTLEEQWQFLVNKSAEKSQKLKEANKQQNFNTGIKDFDFWLSEVTINTHTHQTNQPTHPPTHPSYVTYITIFYTVGLFPLII